MARGSTVLQFEVELSDVDRGVYETLSFNAAQHPSETGAYLVARVLALLLEQRDGVTFTSGLSASDEPAIWVRDLTGQLHDWIEVGTPDGARLHKASKAASRVAVYCHRDPGPWLRNLARERVHEADAIELFALPPDGVDRLAEVVERRNKWSLSRIDGVLYLEAGHGSHQITLERLPWPTP